jgi:hypothetical protein
VLPKELQFGSAGYVAALPAPPAPDLRDALKAANEDGSGSMWHPSGLWLREANLGSIYTDEGTMLCIDHTMFSMADGVTKLIKTPEVLSGNCWTTSGALAVLDGTTLAMRTSPATLHGLDVVVQTWQEGHWSKRSRLLIRYDASLDASSGYCQKEDCRAEVAVALGYARRFARRPLPISLQMVLSAADTKTFARLRALADADAEAVSVMPREEQKLVAYGGYGGMDGFASESVYFPARLNGELLLGRIGHPHVGWREGDDWLVAFWRAKGDHLEAVAGVPVGAGFGELLFAASMPPPKQCESGGRAHDCDE